MNARWLTVFIVVIASAVLLSATIQQNAAQLYQSGVYAEEIEGNLQKAIGIYEQVLKQFPDNLDTAANAQLHIGLCYEKLGLEKARDAYEKVIKKYPGQASAVAVAQAKLDIILRAASLSKKGAPELTIRNIQIPRDPPLELNRVSPDGKYLAYVDANTGDLGVREFSMGNLRRLTNEGNNYSNYAYDPRWSQDSTRLAFAWQRADGFVELRVIALDGSPPRVVLRAKEKEAVAPQDWSPDGNRVLTHFYTFDTKERAQELSLVTVADGSVRNLKAFKNYSVGPDLCFLSPDGRTVAYSRPSREGARERDVFLLSLDSSREIPLVEHPADDTLLEWLPDGRGILFLSDRAGTMDLWTIQVENGQPAGVPTLIRRSIGPVTPMGLTRTGAFYYRTPGSFMDVYTASFDPKTGNVVGSPRKEPLPYEGHNRMPDWSPDGKYLAYASMRPGEKQWVVCIYSTDTGKVREFRPGKTYVFPRWAPDGRHLYLLATSMDGHGIYRMEVQSGEVTPFLGTGEGDASFSLRVSADQKWIVYSVDGKTVDRVVRRDAKTGQEQELDRGLDLGTVALSRDDSHLAWVMKTDEKTWVLKAMEFPDGAPKAIQKLTMTANWNFDIGWSPDGRFIYYCDRTTDQSEWRLRRVAVEGGDSQDLGLAQRYFEQVSVHPDGSRITFSAPPITSEPSRVWVMENFLPARK